MKDIKYEYFVHTWGGFYNEHNKEVHKQEEGSKWFNTKEERDKYIDNLYKLCDSLNTPDACLAKVVAEGYNTRELPTCHRVVEYEGKEYYTKYDWEWSASYSNLRYWMEYKWYPGFNDYPLGEDFDYSKVKVVQEWITGAFDIHEE